MNNSFTYLLGAGASAQVIPVVRGLNNEIGELWKVIRDQYSFNVGDMYYDQDLSVVRKNFLVDMEWLSKEVSEHASVDTFAKKLYLVNDSRNLKKLKALLSFLFLYIQAHNGLDLRYDLFFASILKNNNGNLELPSNLKILSWNYDYQVEMSVGAFKQSDDINIIDGFLNIIPNENNNFSLEKFGIVKLNGTAAGYSENGKIKKGVPFLRKYKDKLTKEDRMVLVKELLLFYHWYIYPMGNTKPLINFAWENDVVSKKVREDALSVSSITDILIVIGYSFPTFNREVDIPLISNMRNLKKVYIQAPSDSIQGVIQRFQSIQPNVEVIGVTSVDEFFIPFEFNTSTI